MGKYRSGCYVWKLSDEESLENVRVLTLSGEAKAHWDRSEKEKTSAC